MEIKTKFEIGQKVWWRLHGDPMVEAHEYGTVLEIIITAHGIRYEVQVLDSYGNPIGTDNQPEFVLYGSYSDLLYDFLSEKEGYLKEELDKVRTTMKQIKKEDR